MPREEHDYQIEEWMFRVADHHAADFSRDQQADDMGRDHSDKGKHHYLSLLAELVYLKHNRANDLADEIAHLPDWNDDAEATDLADSDELWKFDFDAFGRARVDVKMRMVWQAPDFLDGEPDLIIRYSDTAKLHSHLFVQVDLDWDGEWMRREIGGESISFRKPTTGTVVGFATNTTANTAEHYTPNGAYHPETNPNGTRHIKTMVSRDSLHDIDSIRQFAKYLEAQYPDGDSLPRPTGRDDIKSFMKKLGLELPA